MEIERQREMERKRERLGKEGRDRSGK